MSRWRSCRIIFLLFMIPLPGSVIDAVNVMAENDIGSLVVMDQGRIVEEGPTEEGFRIVGVWESEEAWQSFLADRLGEGSGTDGTVPPVSRPLRPAHVVIGARVRPN